jgi:hypothetical protein
MQNCKNKHLLLYLDSLYVDGTTLLLSTARGRGLQSVLQVGHLVS